LAGEKRKRKITGGDATSERNSIDQSLVVVSEKGGDLEGMLNAVGVDIPVAERGKACHTVLLGINCLVL